jgi:integrase
VELVWGVQPDSTAARESTCPVRALRTWLEDAAITSGPIFRKVTRYNTVSKQGLHKASIRIILKKALRKAGMDEDAVEDYGAHSLRAGFVTAAHRNGARLTEIAEQTGHKTLSMVCRYVRDDDDAQSAVRKLGM